MSDYNYEIQTLVQCVAVSGFLFMVIYYGIQNIYNL